jgi:tetratricopeptide (TPR) repeat protein
MQGVQLCRITRERDRADRIADFMTGMFKVANPAEKVGNAVTAREVLDKAVKDIDTGLSKDPELQARMMYEMGLAYLNLGLYSRAQTLFEGSIRAANASVGPENPRTLKTTQRLAWTLFREGKLAEADAQMRKLVDTERRVLGPQNPETVGVMGDMATILDVEGHTLEAEKMQREVLEAQKRLLGPEAHYTLISMDNLASILLREGRLAEAEKLEKETLEIQRRVYGPENMTTLRLTMNYADIKGSMGDDDEAEKLLRQLLDVERRILGPHQPETALTVYDLACLAAKHGRNDDAISLLREAIEIGLLPRVASGMEEDSDLKPLRGDPRFAALVAQAKDHAAAQKAN